MRRRVKKGRPGRRSPPAAVLATPLFRQRRKDNKRRRKDKRQRQHPGEEL